MRMDKLTSQFQTALSDAQSLALGKGNQFIEPVHLLVAMLEQQGTSVRHLLQLAGVNVNQLRSNLADTLDRLPTVEGAAAADVQVSNDLNRLFNVTDKLSQQRQDSYISSELFVLAALDDKGAVGNALQASGANKQQLEKAIEDVRGGEAVMTKMPKKTVRHWKNIVLI